MTNNHQMAQPFNNISLRDKTSFRIGGPARLYCAPEGMDDILDSCAAARVRGDRVFVLGRGTNVLVSDTGFSGLVVDVSSAWTGVQWTGECAVAKSGTVLHALVKDAVERGLGGLEKLAGIPGSVGGAVVMNAGAFGQSVSDCLRSVRFIDLLSAAVHSADASAVAASYRSTRFASANELILEATFCFAKDLAGEARRAFDEVLAKRKSRHPLDLPNCGSVFKNPPGETAGRLIEQAGLKGATRGGAEVSQKHANFIVNRGNASAADVRSLIVHVQKSVYEKTGVLLEPEVVFVGEFEEPLFAP